MARTLIVGAGICGLGTAMLLARDGHDVTVLERDSDQMPDSPTDTWDNWARKGVAQFRQPHNFMPGLRLILERELPDIQEDLRRAGATKFDLLHPMPPSCGDSPVQDIDDKLWTYTARRPVGEWVFSNAVRKEPRITLKHDVRVSELMTGSSVIDGVPHVVGVRTDTGQEELADVVIDATGRGSRSPKWLAEIGARPPSEEQTDFGFTYYTRYFGGQPPQRMGPILSALGSISVLTLPGDNDTWSVTIFTSKDDKPLRALRQEPIWSSVIRECPLQAHWLDGEPLGDVYAMSGVADRYRRFVVDGSPVATGFLAVADAWACSNPSAGRGLTVGMIQAVKLRDSLRESIDDAGELARRFDDLTETEVTPWYDAQIAADRARFAAMEALREGRDVPQPEDELSRQSLALLMTMASDPLLFRSAIEYIGTITPIQEVYERPEVATRVAAAMQQFETSGAPSLPGPTRERLVELAS